MNFGNQPHMNKAVTDAGLVVLKAGFLSSDIFMVTVEQLRLLGMDLPRRGKKGPATARGEAQRYLPIADLVDETEKPNFQI